MSDRNPKVPRHRKTDTSIAAANDLAPKLGHLHKLALETIRSAGPGGSHHRGTGNPAGEGASLDVSARQRIEAVGLDPRRRPAPSEPYRQAGHRLGRRVSLAAMPCTPKRVRHGGALKLHRTADFGEVSNALPRPKIPANQPAPETGTEPAIKYLFLGVPANSACSTGRGGSRNRADRESDALTAAQVDNLMAASAHACTIERPFTRMITIHWESAGVPLHEMAKATGRFLDLMAKALKRHGRSTTWLWVHENGPRKGGHVHILIHVPGHLVPIVSRSQKRWLKAITGQPYRAKVIHSEPIGGRLGLEVGNPDLHAANLDEALGYVLKGAYEGAAVRFGLDRLDPGGRIIGKRCGTSQNIGAKARRG